MQIFANFILNTKTETKTNTPSFNSLQLLYWVAFVKWSRVSLHLKATEHMWVDDAGFFHLSIFSVDYSKTTKLQLQPLFKKTTYSILVISIFFIQNYFSCVALLRKYIFFNKELSFYM
jgi:hypothetical protein